jgi:leucyl aminopeptidase
MNIEVTNELAKKSIVVIPMFNGLPAAHGVEISKVFDNLDISRLCEGNNKGLNYYGCFDKNDSYIVVANMPDNKEVTYEDIRKTYADIIRQKFPEYYDNISIILPKIDGLTEDGIISAVVEGIRLGSYTYDKYKSSKNESIGHVFIYIGNCVCKDKASSLLKRSNIICDAVNLARDLVNEPANKLTPEIFASRILDEMLGSSVQVEILDKTELENRKINGVLAVGKGSIRPPKLAILKYFSSNSSPTIALIGKGLTNDMGGVNIKTGRNLSGTRNDMGGAAAVLGAIRILSQLEIKANVIGIMPMVENICDGGSYKPGEIIEYANGITVEVQNTDAEGRLVLADCIIMARDMNADMIIDIATLTGSCSRALGSKIAGVLGTDSLVQDIIQAGLECGEMFWKMPLYNEYRKALDSDIADIANIGDSEPGVITAALFLKEFAGEATWAHLDIAGNVNASSTEGYRIKGGTGFGVRTLTTLVKNIVAKYENSQN